MLELMLVNYKSIRTKYTAIDTSLKNLVPVYVLLTIVTIYRPIITLLINVKLASFALVA